MGMPYVEVVVDPTMEPGTFRVEQKVPSSACQCKLPQCKRSPACRREITAEDLLCDHCRKIAKAKADLEAGREVPRELADLVEMHCHCGLYGILAGLS